MTPRPRPALVVAALAALPALAAPAAAAPARVVADQPGLVRQVVLGDRDVVWTRCLRATGPTEVWWARRSAGAARRVPRLRIAGDCAPIRIVAATGDRALLVTTIGTGLARLELVDLPSGRRTPLEVETLPASGVRIPAADAEGVRMAWLRTTGLGDARVTETVVGDLRRPVDVALAGVAGGRPVDARLLGPGAVTPTGVWVAPGGRVVVREHLAGAIYGYGTGRERLRVAGPGGRELVRTGPDVRIAAADLTDRVLAYTLADRLSGRTWLYRIDLASGRRRLVRRLGPLPAAVPREVPALVAPSVSGPLLAWRERRRAPGGWADRVLALDLLRGRTTTLARLTDGRAQRVFLSQPSTRSGRVAWAEIRSPRAAGPVGGFYGLTPPGARSRVVVAAVR